MGRARALCTAREYRRTHVANALLNERCRRPRITSAQIERSEAPVRARRSPVATTRKRAHERAANAHTKFVLVRACRVCALFVRLPPCRSAWLRRRPARSRKARILPETQRAESIRHLSNGRPLFPRFIARSFSPVCHTHSLPPCLHARVCARPLCQGLAVPEPESSNGLIF